MFKVKQLFTKNYLLLLQIVIFLVNVNGFEVIRSQSLKVLKSYQNCLVMSTKKLLVVPNNFLLYHEIAASHTAIFKTPAILLHQTNVTLTMAKNMHAFYSYSYCENATWQFDPTANIMDIVCTVYCIASIIQHESFLYRIVQKLSRASTRFFQRLKRQFSKKNSAIQLKSNRAIKLKYMLQCFKCRSTPISLTLLLFCDTNLL